MGGVETQQRLEPMVAAAMGASLSVTLHFIRLFRLPQGGSVTLASALPVWIVARRFGFKAGLACGATTGLLLAMLEARPVHWLQPITDYPLAYGVLGLAAMTSSPIRGALLSTAARFAIHVASGVAFFSSFAPPGTSPLMFSLAYNASYVLPDLILALCLLVALQTRAPHLLVKSPS